VNQKAKSPTHRVLAAMMGGLISTTSLHKATKTAGQSHNRWSIEALNPLIQRKLIRQDGYNLAITKDGMELFFDLERKSNINLHTMALPRQVQVMRTEVYKSDKTTAYVRPGANDFLKCPSRVGNKLVYREDVNDYE
jgi:hypothetical protein|tara:strand:- start:24 stop:434 length:411 start_codon:yes stop_codon:yes gene_type:complete